jgi:hypothetical protein
MTGKPEPHRLQDDPPEGSRETIERELRRQENRRETGVRKPEESAPTEDEEVDPYSQTDAVLPRKPKPYGLTEPVNEPQDKTHQSDGVNESSRRR